MLEARQPDEAVSGCACSRAASVRLPRVIRWLAIVAPSAVRKRGAGDAGKHVYAIAQVSEVKKGDVLRVGAVASASSGRYETLHRSAAWVIPNFALVDFLPAIGQVATSASCRAPARRCSVSVRLTVAKPYVE